MSGALSQQSLPPGLMQRLRSVDVRALDGLLALLLTAGALTALLSRAGTDRGTFRDDDALGIALVVLQVLPLAARRSAPLPVFALTIVAIDLHAALGFEMVQFGTFGSLVALYGVASLCDTRRAQFGALLMAVAFVGFFATSRQEFEPGGIVSTCATWAAAWCLGVYVRVRGEQAETARERVGWLEREREVLAREAVAAERSRITRELHDIVGHALNVIVLQAGGAQRVIDAKPEAARASLASIESTSRTALTEIERMLGMLGDAEDAHQGLGARPGLGHLGQLAARVNDAGLSVAVTVEGTPTDLPQSIDLSAYRIIQEALTNALKHADAGHARVTVRYLVDALDIEVVDDGRGAESGLSSTSGGRGIIGMRERAALFGGELTVGPAAGRGFRVHARLPLGGEAV